MMAGRLQAIALAAGEIDYAASVETMIRSTVQGMPFKIIVYTNARMSVVLVTPAQINSVGDLRGNTVGVTSLGSGLEYGLREILIQKGNLNPDRDVRIVSLGMPEQMLGLTSGSLQGAMLVPPNDGNMARKGYRRLVSAVDRLEYPQGRLSDHRQEDQRKTGASEKNHPRDDPSLDADSRRARPDHRLHREPLKDRPGSRRRQLRHSPFV